MQLERLSVPARIAVGETLSCELELRSAAAQNLLVALRVHFRKANGTLAPKVFTVRKAPFARGERAQLRKAIAFRPMTTRVLYPGAHHLELVVNGRTLAEAPFELTA